MSAKFDRLALNDHSYRFDVVSTNDLGSSVVATDIVVPRKTHLLQIGLQLTHSYESEGYELKWHFNQAAAADIRNFTIFLCPAKSAAPNSCEGKLKATTVNSVKNTFYYNTTETLNFAIAANTANATTGMVWTECISNPANGRLACLENHTDGALCNFIFLEIGKPTTVFVPSNDVDKYSFTVQWMVNCRDVSIVKAFILEYCSVELNSTRDSTCMSDVKTIRLNDTTLRVYKLNNLQPYTRYKIFLQMISTDNTRGNAVHTYERTKEAGKFAH